MSTTVSQRLDAFRQLMQQAGVDAVIIPQADPHMSEYLAAHWQVRRMLSGFTGSAGDLVITNNSAALWTDSRYFLQAAEQLQGTGIELMKDGLAETPSIEQYLVSVLEKGATVALDGMLFPHTALTALCNTLESKGFEVKVDFDVVDKVWADRPALPDAKIFVHDEKFAGESARSKIEKIVAVASEAGARSIFVSALDEIAWTLNIRCSDVKHTPVATAFLYLSNGCNILFIDPAKLTDSVVAYLASQGVTTRGYSEVKEFLAALPADEKVMVESARTAGAIVAILGTRVVESGISTAARLKSVKNEVQLKGVRNAMERDGVAL
ncbi:MAG: aminopeptidase P family N-terminal domain-containing protein, partial [Muribaculaceae bacterium]|nr:aminopeptidase P family N-terminal domain-containing protein [Muribaculaceae bacterium]